MIVDVLDIVEERKMLYHQNLFQNSNHRLKEWNAKRNTLSCLADLHIFDKLLSKPFVC